MSQKDPGDSFDKHPLRSKKFIAYIVTSILWKAIILSAIILHGDAIGLLGTVTICLMVVTEGAISVGYIIGQAGLDRYVRLAQITAGQVTGGKLPDQRAPLNLFPSQDIDEIPHQPFKTDGSFEVGQRLTAEGAPLTEEDLEEG